MKKLLFSTQVFSYLLISLPAWVLWSKNIKKSVDFHFSTSIHITRLKHITEHCNKVIAKG